MFKFVRIRKNVDKNVDNIFLNNSSTQYKTKKVTKKAYLWIKNDKKTRLSTTYPHFVDIWIVTMWKCG